VLYSRIVPEPVVEIPNRPAFRASEVCELVQIPPYVLKSWEKEFPGLGVAAKPGGPRVYRRSDVEQVLKIKQLLFNEGLTLAGARRKLEGEPKVEDEPLPELPAAAGDVRDKVARVKQELRSLLELLSSPPPTSAPAAANVKEELPQATPASEEPSSAPAPAWPPAAVAPPGATPATEQADTALPLLDGVESAAASKAPRRPRRVSRSERDAG
jgi:DNA-binding transcriptional MerR regulator